MQHPAQQHAGRRDKRAAGFQQQAQAEISDAGQERSGQVGRRQGAAIGVGIAALPALIVDAQAATNVKQAQGIAVAEQPPRQVGQQVYCLYEGAKLGDLGTDVTVDADGLQGRQAGELGVGGLSLADGDTELARRDPRGNVAVGVGIDTGIDPDGYRRAPPQAVGNGGDALQLLDGVSVDG